MLITSSILINSWVFSLLWLWPWDVVCKLRGNKMVSSHTRGHIKIESTRGHLNLECISAVVRAPLFTLFILCFRRGEDWAFNVGFVEARDLHLATNEDKILSIASWSWLLMSAIGFRVGIRDGILVLSQMTSSNPRKSYEHKRCECHKKFIPIRFRIIPLS